MRLLKAVGEDPSLPLFSFRWSPEILGVPCLVDLAFQSLRPYACGVLPVFVWLFPFLGMTSVIELVCTVRISPSPDYLCKDPISKFTFTGMRGQLGFKIFIYFLGGGLQFQPLEWTRLERVQKLDRKVVRAEIMQGFAR